MILVTRKTLLRIAFALGLLVTQWISLSLSSQASASTLAPLKNSKPLEKALEKAIFSAARRAPSAAICAGGNFGVLNLKDEFPQYAMVRGNLTLYAASLPKIVLLGAAFDKLGGKDPSHEHLVIGHGRSHTIYELLHDMIYRSGNASAGLIWRWLGHDRIEKFLLEKGLFKGGNGLWVGRAYGRLGRTNYHPTKTYVHGASQAANVKSVLWFYHLLSQGRLVSSEADEQMLRLLSDSHPKLRDRFYILKDEETTLFRKSGSWQQYVSDSAWVVKPGRSYALVGLTRCGTKKGKAFLEAFALSMDQEIKEGEL